MQKHLDQSTILDIASAALAEQFSKIPRLARLVRIAAEYPHIDDCLLQAVSLARNMYTNDPGPLISSALIATTLVHTASPKISSHIPDSFHYVSTEDFELANKYYSYRCLLCGLIQKLCTLGPIASTRFNLSTIEAEDIEAANTIAMMVDYALVCEEPFPRNALRLHGPLECSLGSWHRLEKRTRRFSAEARHARKMQDWCLSMAEATLKGWGAKQNSLRLVQTKMEAFAGGPLSEELRWKIGLADMVSEMGEMSMQP